MNAGTGGGAQPKNILLFSDGTGNSSAKLFKTNVWRLYQAVDTSSEVPEGQPLQIVAYDDGVGTSSFKPFALLGGAFGVGLKRNVLDLYQFVCLNYEPGDRIYAFGFSRGAFTIRVLVGLLTTVGIIDARGMDHGVLDQLSRDAYRELRRCFRLGGNRQAAGDSADKSARTDQAARGSSADESGRPDQATGDPSRGKRDRTDLFVTPLRDFRDRRIARKRRKAGLPVLDRDKHIREIPDIAFVGVWDTVAAYGSPIAEVTKGIDRWVWPLSMPDYKLSPKVRMARHALALDDERDTFHPLLWDEVNERELIGSDQVSPTRLRQVWFSGMHSDIGGGYPDDSLAHVSLVWMVDEAIKAGMRVRDDALADFRAQANPHGPMHDSRAGIGAYYRYQPRKISARLAVPDPTTRILQDPDMKGQGLLTEVRVHQSVLDRIARRDGYAPIVLPGEYVVEGGDIREALPNERAAAQERIWDLVWRRRLHYFLTLTLTLGLVALALFPRLGPDAQATCVGPQCFISPWLRAAGELLPAFASPWVEAFAQRPGTFLVLLLGIVWLLRKTGKIESALRDAMRGLFRLSLRTPNDQLVDGKTLDDARRELDKLAKEEGFVRQLRRSSPYQVGMQYLKWRLAPGAAAVAIYAASAVLAVTLLSSLVSIVHRTQLVWVERVQTFCPDGGENLSADSDPALFATSDMCWRVPGEGVTAGERYRLRLDVEVPWVDGYPTFPEADADTWLGSTLASLRASFLRCFTLPPERSIPASPAGFDTHRFNWCVRWPAALLRRSTSDPWFRPLLYVEREAWAQPGFQGVPMQIADYDGRAYVGEFVAPASGRVVLSVNDAVSLWGGGRNFFYKDNVGTARVTIEPCMGQVKRPCDFVD